MTSILVAVHNAEQTLSTCLDSLLHQSADDIQIICIDDASTDSSVSILRDYASRHANIDLVLLNENHGQAFARNQGIPLIRGEYTAFLDSDDRMAPDCIEKVERTFRSNPTTDCVLLNTIYEYPDGRRHAYRSDREDIDPPFDVLTGYEAFKRALTWDVHGWYVARTELYRTYPFDDTCHSYSDDNTTMEHYLHSREVRWCDARYYFIQHPDSCTRGLSIRRFDWLKANEAMHQRLVLWQMPHDIIDLYEEQRYYNLLECIRLYLRSKDAFTPAEQSSIIGTIHNAWRSIDTSTCLPWRVKYKPLYMPLHPFWSLFVFEQEIWCLVNAFFK